MSPGDAPSAGEASGPAPGWFWLAVVLGAAARLWMMLATEGTYDIRIWAEHMPLVDRVGLVEAYTASEKWNHPPPATLLMYGLWSLSEALGVPFRILQRLPMVVADVGSALLLLELLRSRSDRHAIAALYWMHPLAWVLAAYHGNTDAILACAALGAIVQFRKGSALGAGVALGLALWVKLPIVLVAPALLFAFEDTRDRVRLVAATGATALVGYLPVLASDPLGVIQGVLLYGGQNIQTTAGIRVWGIQNFYPTSEGLSANAAATYHRLVQLSYDLNTLTTTLPAVLIAWARRARRSPAEVACTAACGTVAFYGFTNYWSFQYFAWAIPLWFFLGRRLSVALHLAATAYVCALYATVTGNPWLLGEWDFVGNPIWPWWLLLLRNLAIGTFFVGAWIALVGAYQDWEDDWKRPADSPEEPEGEAQP